MRRRWPYLLVTSACAHADHSHRRHRTENRTRQPASGLRRRDPSDLRVCGETARHRGGNLMVIPSTREPRESMRYSSRGTQAKRGNRFLHQSWAGIGPPTTLRLPKLTGEVIIIWLVLTLADDAAHSDLFVSADHGITWRLVKRIGHFATIL